MNEEELKKENWFSKHADTLVVIGAIVGSILWMNGKFNDVDKDLASIRLDINTIKTILVVKGIYPNELAKCHETKDQ